MESNYLHNAGTGGKTHTVVPVDLFSHFCFYEKINKYISPVIAFLIWLVEREKASK